MFSIKRLEILDLEWKYCLAHTTIPGSVDTLIYSQHLKASQALLWEGTMIIFPSAVARLATLPRVLVLQISIGKKKSVPLEYHF